MSFGDVKTAEGLAKFDAFLKAHSYVSGYTPSKCDCATFDSLGKAPEAKYVNATRWYKHIASFTGDERKHWGEGSAAAAPAKAAAAADDDFDMFGESDEDEEKKQETAARLAAYAQKKSGKPVLIAKSSILLDVKPWDDETDMAEMEKRVRSVQCDGLVWGASKLVPLAYGIKKLQIGCVVEDDKVGTDFLEEEITKFEDLVQSVDIAAFNKI